MSTPNPAVILPLRWLIAIRCDRFIDEVLAHTRLREDLHLDSMEMAELLIDIEDSHGVTLDAAELATVQTVAELEAAVTQCQPGRVLPDIPPVAAGDR